ncbi:MAG: hypothetical protein M3157_06845, partial [Actinomycetota bacterium]|nr:hypothetical protein [Actinomycetota bacterium]
LKLELEHASTTAEERRRKELKELKRLAEGRERELRRVQAARLAEEKETAERRIAALKAQREADNNSLKERHTGELAQVRRTLEQRLAAEEERRRTETAALEERLQGLRTQRESEARLYRERLEELERERVADKATLEEGFEERLAQVEREKARLEDRIAELQDALEESGAIEAELREALGRSAPRRREAPRMGAAEEETGDTPREATAQARSEESYEALQARLREVEEEVRRRARELEQARESLKKVADPEQRLRAGISLFNESEHTRTVASISKALGLPKVHVGPGGSSASANPTITFAWSDMAWRRYVSDPTEGVEEPRVYLIGAGDDPAEIRSSGLQANARMDARGRLILGVQAR